MQTMKLVCALVILLLSACGESQTTTTTSSASGAASGASSNTPAEAEGLTTPACVTYLEKTKACIQKAPEAEREPRTKAIEEIEKTWTEQSKTADGRKRLLTSCSAALKQFEETGTCQ